MLALCLSTGSLQAASVQSGLRPIPNLTFGYGQGVLHSGALFNLDQTLAGLAKKAPYTFGLGKRSQHKLLDEVPQQPNWPGSWNSPYAFGMGKRMALDYDPALPRRIATGA